jgi:hypothetical protein
LSVENIKVVLANLPALAADLLEQAISNQPGMAVVGRAGCPGGVDADQLLRCARTAAADVLIVGASADDLPLAVLAEQHTVKVLGIEAVNGSAHLYELRPQHVTLGDLSPADLTAVIKHTTRGPRPA